MLAFTSPLLACSFLCVFPGGRERFLTTRPRCRPKWKDTEVSSMLMYKGSFPPRLDLTHLLHCRKILTLVGLNSKLEKLAGSLQVGARNSLRSQTAPRRSDGARGLASPSVLESLDLRWEV